MTRIAVVSAGLVTLGLGGVASGQGPAVSIVVSRVISRTLDRAVRIPGDLMAYQAVDLHARVSGFVESVAVDRGSRVTRGQRLGRLSAPELRAQRAEAEAKVKAVHAQQAEARARMVSAQSTFERLRSASATPGVVAGNDLEVAERTFEASRAQVEALESSGVAAAAALAAVTELEAYLEILAPFDGVITERHVHPGSLVGPSAGPLLRIEQVSRLRLTVPVPETYVAGIRKGATVEFQVSAFPGQTFRGVIARPAHSLDVQTRSMLVELDVQNAQLTLAPGMFAEVQWPIARAEPTLFVPTTAVVRTTERQFVIRVRNGAAEWVDVRRGEVADGLIEVFGDLREGETVVRRGNDEIRDGSRVTASGEK
jgi:RND family efflux transporter MFP subunit